MKRAPELASGARCDTCDKHPNSPLTRAYRERVGMGVTGVTGTRKPLTALVDFPPADLLARMGLRPGGPSFSLGNMGARPIFLPLPIRGKITPAELTRNKAPFTRLGPVPPEARSRQSEPMAPAGASLLIRWARHHPATKPSTVRFPVAGPVLATVPPSCGQHPLSPQPHV